MIRDESARSVVQVCECGARDVAVSAAAADSWQRAHLRVCQLVTRQRERDRIMAALATRTRRREQQ